MNTSEVSCRSSKRWFTSFWKAFFSRGESSTRLGFRRTVGLSGRSRCIGARVFRGNRHEERRTGAREKGRNVTESATRAEPRDRGNNETREGGEESEMLAAREDQA
ncbi:uncharacterized protein LOC143151194 [Ptiloglossa arizonensis]|uniref:uncharacterized protein LOC143151194 n=1 Tax=Ptiloglossa arizonensis TaxID=3350558 RepID=UPI003F9F5EDF